MHEKAMARLFVAAATTALIGAGCGDSDGKESGSKGGAITGGDLVIRGLVSDAGGGSGMAAGGGSPLVGATVRVSIDVDGDGRISDGERLETTTDEEGRYELSAGAEEGQTVVVSFREQGYAPVFRRVEAAPKGEAVINAALASFGTLECEGPRCTMEGNKLSITGLDEGISGQARVFNPVTETHHFPGGFDDSDGNLLISGVFAAVELQDPAGDELSQLDEEVELRMQVPRDTWPVIVDLQPGNDRVELPFYHFDEVLGTWVRHDKDGWLENGDGEMVAESELEAIRAGDYEGVLFAAGEVDHFSYWNLDWPVESHACIEGMVHAADGSVAEGATVTATGITYTGTSASQTTGADGLFTLDVMRSEGDDDVDQDGTPGEVHQIALRVVHDGKVYDAGTFDAPEEQGSDGENCGDLGMIMLTPDKELQAGLCTVQGTIYDETGAPLANAVVYAWDNAVPSEAQAALCGEFLENCTFYVQSGSDGSYEATTVVMEMLQVWGMHSSEAEGLTRFRHGTNTRHGCPEGPVDIQLAEGWDMFELAVELNGDQISWSPEVEVHQIAVVGETYKWMISAEDGGSFDGPVTYGVTPEGAVTIFPWDQSSPDPLTSGDMIQVVSSTYGDTGIWTWATGTAVVP